MQWITKRNGAILSAILVAVMVSQLIMYSMGSWIWKRDGAFADSDQDLAGGDTQIAVELSNMTGVTVDQILEMKASGLSWNEVTRQLQADDVVSEEGREERFSLLFNSGLSEQATDELIAAGYQEEAITEAKLVAERVVFQLTELVQQTPHVPVPQVAAIQSETSDEEEQKTEVYRQLLELFDLEEAVRLMLAWEVNVGSFRQALNEYLFMLQSGLAVEDYVQDWDRYEEQKNKRKAEQIGELWITVEMIEQDMLDAVQERNQQQETEHSSPALSSSSLSQADQATDALPRSPVPEIRDVRPPDPTAAIHEEIKNLDPREAFQ